VKHSEQLDRLADALSKAQGEIQNVVKDAKNPHYKNEYASLDAVTDTVRPIFAKHGLSVAQVPEYADGIVTVATLLLHSSGQWILGLPAAPLSKADAQGVGSATTYLRRYSLAGLAAIAQTDDDGEGARAPARGATIVEDRKLPTYRPAEPPTEAPDAPAGYDNWLTDLVATADNGIAEFEDAFGKAKIEYRRHLTQTDVERYGNLRAKARRVGSPITVKAPK